MFLSQPQEALHCFPGAVAHDVHGIGLLPNLVGRGQRRRLLLRLEVRGVPTICVSHHVASCLA